MYLLALAGPSTNMILSKCPRDASPSAVRGFAKGEFNYELSLPRRQEAICASKRMDSRAPMGKETSHLADVQCVQEAHTSCTSCSAAEIS